MITKRFLIVQQILLCQYLRKCKDNFMENVQDVRYKELIIIYKQCEVSNHI